MADFLPQSDTEFASRAAQILDYITAHLSELNLTTDDIHKASTVRVAFEDALGAHQSAQSAAHAARQAKDDSRDPYAEEIRTLVRQIQADKEIPDLHRSAMGLTIRDTTRTPQTAPTSVPVLHISSIQRLQHEVSFRDEHTPTSAAKPAGIQGCEIWTKLGGDPPHDLTDCHYLATDTATPYTAKLPASEIGKTAHYIACWVNRKGERGPLSAPVSATIAG